MSPAEIRLATEHDVEAVVEVGRRAWPVVYGPIAGEDYVQMGLAKWWTVEATRPLVEAGKATVAEVDGELVAVAVVGPLHGDLVLFRLYVIPEFQGQGIGSLLIHDVFERARQAGHRIIRLSYLDGNEGAAAFYRGFGFLESHREATGLGIPDSVWVVRHLWEPLPDGLEAPE
ncbi:MAG: GNAT family N-acetyltransferase [Candidatus Phosphoribacter sp.]|nr:GNAT family N-acetyltransferase [Actinomycetales bacterium]